MTSLRNSIGSIFCRCLKCNLQIGDIINFSYLHHAAVGEVRSLRLNIVSIQYDGHEILLACVLLICRLKIFFRVSIFFVLTNTQMTSTTKFFISKYLQSVSTTITVKFTIFLLVRHPLVKRIKTIYLRQYYIFYAINIFGFSGILLFW